LIPLFDVALNYGFEFARNKANNSASVQTGSDVTGTWFTGPTPSGERTISSGFLSSTFTHNEWLSLIVGGRFDHYSLNGRGSYANGVDAGLTDFSVDNSEHRFLPKATLAVKPLDGLQVYGTYMEGWRPPTLLETLFHGNHIGQSPTSAFFAPNPSLEAETSKTWELGTNYKKNGLFFSADALRLKAAYFETTAENYIMLAGVGIPFNSGAVPRSLASYVNLTNTTQLKGFEVEANYDAGPAYIGVSYSRLTNNFDDADYNFWANGRGSLIPPVWWTEDAAKTSVFQLFAPPKQKVTVDGGVRLFDRVLTLGARATFVDRGDHAGNQTVFMNTKAYQIYDLYGSYKFGESLTARFSVENLTDVAYVDAMGVVDYPAPGRTFTISLSSRF
jgi:TonB-dependent heme/hemoglobin receptor